MKMRNLVLIFALFAVAGCLFEPVESKSLSYKTYIAKHGKETLDPLGASDIYVCEYTTRDGYDYLWRFVISEKDGDRIAAVVASGNKGPKILQWEGSAEDPPNWKAQGGESSPPDWWSRDAGIRAKSVHWCYAAGDAERHHGWFFLYDRGSKMMYCWHWNHQWSSAECPNR